MTLFGFLLENYYLANLFFAMGLVSALLIYLSRFSPEDRRTVAFQRVLLVSLSWAFFDLAISQVATQYPPEVSFKFYRYASILFLLYPPACGELILSLIGKATWKLRAGLYFLFLLLYITGLIFPEWVSAGTFNIPGGYPGTQGPWNIAFKFMSTSVNFLFLTILALNARKDVDPMARREKIVLVCGGGLTIVGIITAQILKNTFGPEFPWMANLATVTTNLAAFLGLKQYGRVLSPRALYATTIRVTPNGMAHLRGGRIIWSNQGLARLLEVTEPELLFGRRLADLLGRAASSGEIDQELVERLSRGEIKDQEITLARTNGGLVHCLAGSAPLDPGDPAQGALVIFTDISERKRSEQERASLQTQLQHSQKMEAVGTLASGIAHDFNNILQAISGFVQLLLKKNRIDPDSGKYLLEIDQAVERASDLVQRLLTFSRKVEPELKPTNLNQVVIRTIRLLERTIPKMIKIETGLAENLKIISADPNQLERVLVNLATNARDAMPVEGTLAIETANMTLLEGDRALQPEISAGEYVLLKVTDTGHGMPSGTVERIYEPFFTTKGVGQGTGLGLSAVYGIVKSHGGVIVCDSQPGKGTAFSIYFPASPLQDILRATAASGVEEEEVRGQETILLVDDEKAILEAARDVLEEMGFTIMTAGSGEEAVALFQENRDRFDLVILDLGMPGMGGQRCLEELLRIEPGLKVIIASGYSADGQSRAALAAGAKGFISKPYRLSDLLKMVRDVLNEERKDTVH